MRKIMLAAAAAFSATGACAQPTAQPLAATGPKLLIVISVDQFSADLWDEYRPQFSGGFARLATGTVFHNGYQSHATTETCPGHSTILTGARPGRTGIVANGWFDPKANRSDKNVYCAEDERAPGSNSANYTVSSAHLRVPTLGELLKRSSSASLNVAVAGKDRAAVMMSGHVADQRWYWDQNQFSTDLRGALPRSVAAVNLATAQAIAKGLPALDPPPFCAAKAQAYKLAPPPGRTVGAGRLERAPGDADTFRASPQLDASVLALSAALIRELGLGSDAAPDVLSISLSATDYVGHAFGPGGQEMCLQLLSLDRDLGDFLKQLDRWGLDYAVALTADHGGLDVPERLHAKGIRDAAWVDPALTASVLGPKVAATTGLKGPIIIAGGPFSEIYLDPVLQGAERKRAVEALVAAYRAHPQVHAVFTREDIAQAPMPKGSVEHWTVMDRVRASFDQARSGDLYVVSKPYVQPIADTSRYVATHGSPWDYDRRVPIIFWRPGTAGAPRDEAAETVDIMPTLAAMLGLRIAASEIDGHCLSSVAGVTCASR